ncbi:UrcA family protein [Phenylobacterium sp.]|uniref:UrcA family protein n=1 Tax=Phenylobacterium sp. TaxID=1871053 RepID=UPI0025D3CF32|nr:UrcA family protein [Phenylobacterium sp.]MBX3483809.1 UrcA family protein [Phenylobacterium sp.]MCW5760677.1 UrcA family protein [Phenylobacterium sp.]
MRRLPWMLAASALVGSALVAAPAAAQPRSYLMTPVPLAGLDLGSDAGGKAMLKRLDAASRGMCAQIRTPLLPGAEGRAWKCRREAVAAAKARLNEAV